MTRQVCRQCGRGFAHEHRGRPFNNCPRCRQKANRQATERFAGAGGDVSWVEPYRDTLR